MECTWVIGGLGLAVWLLYKYMTWNWGYWKNKGIAEVKPNSIIFGNLSDVIMMKKHAGIFYDEIYKMYPEEPVVGLYKMRQPQLLIRDADLIRHMFATEFSSFHDNDIVEGHPKDYISYNHPFMARGDRWKQIRSISARALTGGKIKGMVPHMVTVCKELTQHILHLQDTFVEASELGSKYTAEVVLGCVYGLQVNTFKDPNTKYKKEMDKFFHPDWKGVIVFLIIGFMPTLTYLLKLNIIPKSFREFYEHIVREAIKYRKEKGVKGSDYLQSLLDDNKFSVEEITAHTVTFIIDGYETSAVHLSNILDYLSKHPDIQDKLRKEVKASLNSLDDITFEKLHSMNYLTAVLNEALRIRPPGGIARKICTKDIKLEWKGKIYDFKKGDSLVYSIISVQNDPKNYEDPDLFKPERFMDGTANFAALMGFGVGPRLCPGQLFASTQVKAAICAIILQFQVIAKENGNATAHFDQSSLLLQPAGGIQVKFRSQNS